MTREALLNNVAALVKSKLKPLVDDIDLQRPVPERIYAGIGQNRRFARPVRLKKAVTVWVWQRKSPYCAKSVKNAAPLRSAHGVRRLARAFQTTKLRAILQGNAFPLAAGDKTSHSCRRFGRYSPKYGLRQYWIPKAKRR